jgi:hypothetical protein
MIHEIAANVKPLGMIVVCRNRLRKSPEKNPVCAISATLSNELSMLKTSQGTTMHHHAPLSHKIFSTNPELIRL